MTQIWTPAAGSVEEFDLAVQELEQAAHRSQAEKEAAEDFSVARCKLLMDRSAVGTFYAHLGMKLVPASDWGIDTAATDGRRILYNPDFWLKLPKDERIGVLCHEIMHNVLDYFGRIGFRTAQRFNVAHDLAINPMIRQQGLKLPKEGCFPGEGPFKDLPVGLCAEEYYALLPKRPDGSDWGDGDFPVDIGGCGKAIDRPGDIKGRRLTEAEKLQLTEEWRQSVEQAAKAARTRGNLPSALDALIGEILSPSTNWRDQLREFVCANSKNDYSWSVPNRRYIAQGLYLPSLHSEDLGTVLIGIDQSGSTDEDQQRQWAAELESVLSAYDCRLVTYYHDTEVAAVEEWTPDSGPLEFKRYCSGGTSHRPVMEQMLDEHPDASCIIFFTDLETEYPDEPSVPVLWAVTNNRKVDDPPFGRRIDVELQT